MIFTPKILFALFLVITPLVSFCKEASQIFNEVNPSVVGVFNFSKTNDKSTSNLSALGSGFFWGPDCLILTNHHVVKNANKIGISILGQRKGLSAQILGAEPKLDLAILKLEKLFNCRPVKINSQQLEVGATVYAIGNPIGLERTLTSGIVSALNRSLDETTFHRLIQTDAPLFPGNSGGPLISASGETIGINTLSSSAGTGISFALPLQVIAPLLPEIIQHRSLKKRTLGIKAQQFEEKEKLTLSDYLGGVLVGSVFAGSPAEKAGLKKNDLIIESHKKTLQSIHDLEMELYSNPLGSFLELVVIRDNKELTLKIRVQE